MNSTKITIHTKVSADIQKTWDYYTDPKHIIRWNFASDDWQCPIASNDMRIGGKYSARMEAKDGSFGFDFEAIYNEITEGQGFVYTMPDDRQVNVYFQSQGNLTEIRIIFDAEKENAVDLQKNGWQAILNNFKNYVESH
jgi:uncharacterized protein YndB with AHSA1/START domain